LRAEPILRIELVRSAERVSMPYDVVIPWRPKALAFENQTKDGFNVNKA
jgi:hypothetical protein